MLLRDYLLLNLGPTSEAEFTTWRKDMIARRRVDACRDILAFRWSREAAVAACLIASPARVAGDPEALQRALETAARKALEHIDDYAGATVTAAADDGVLVAEVQVQGEAPPDGRALANALAYFVEETLGYAQAAVHPVAYEEQMRP